MVLMPSYEFECIACNVRFMVERSIHEDNPPMCCGLVMRQIYGAPSISFKGKGWGKDA
jgi:putative FmdB family regulatory protein